MKTSRSRLALAGRRGTMLGAALALLAGVVAAPAAQAQETTPGTVSDASFVWGVSGYAQENPTPFGPWKMLDTTGDASFLTGSISGGSQTEYTPAPFPATSMTTKLVGGVQSTPNAVKFSDGEGTRDANGTLTIGWDGSFTYNAYPVNIGAPSETITDPSLTVEADGSGSLTAGFDVGSGAGMGGEPSPPENLGRQTIATFSPGAMTASPTGVVTIAPDYKGVVNTESQIDDCIGSNVWGSWPADFVSALPASVRPHYYSTGCGGTQNYKGALPFQVDYDVTEEETQAPIGTPKIEVSQSSLSAEGEHQVTVTGTGFNDPSVVGTRPPLAGQPSGAYVVFGKFLDEWKPSANAPSTARAVVEQRWALPTGSFTAMGGQLPYIEITADGSFTATLTVSKAAADAKSELGGYGIYTYPAGGAKKASYEQFVPVVFTPADNGGGDDNGGDDDDDDTGTIGGGSLAGMTNLFGSLI
ncbi:hypothetical protein [Rhodococcus sp. IEGM 1408]|uniref:hypothetical protein n=1 Tax=Rhodococcus sp. IEGM 1408 TaxID=3082220 RepID=UPI0029559A3E|nr:hypothetical protein [Rhodococcus sp. IEGM 1408]MDV8001039.1 hypothetical protein [Rhodococcus sp. IEGM 1408]